MPRPKVSISASAQEAAGIIIVIMTATITATTALDPITGRTLHTDIPTATTARTDTSTDIEASGSCDAFAYATDRATERLSNIGG